MSSVSQERLKELFLYSKETGLITRRVRSGKSIKGSIAGTLLDSGYINIQIDKKLYRAHRLAWLYVYGVWPINDIDHINHVRSDNRIENLRDVTRSENLRNCSQSRGVGVLGVNWYKPYGMYRARIRSNNKEVNLGYFNDKFEAICARKSAQNKYGYHANHGL